MPPHELGATSGTEFVHARGGRSYPIGGAGHALFQDRREAVQPEIDRFLD